MMVGSNVALLADRPTKPNTSSKARSLVTSSRGGWIKDTSTTRCHQTPILNQKLCASSQTSISQRLTRKDSHGPWKTVMMVRVIGSWPHYGVATDIYGGIIASFVQVLLSELGNQAHLDRLTIYQARPNRKKGSVRPSSPTSSARQHIDRQ